MSGPPPHGPRGRSGIQPKHLPAITDAQVDWSDMVAYLLGVMADDIHDHPQPDVARRRRWIEQLRGLQARLSPEETP